MDKDKRARKNKQLFFLGLLIGGAMFIYGRHLENKQNLEYKQKQIQYAATKLEEIFPALNTLHHQRVQYAIDEFPDLKSNQAIQKKLMDQMAMNITNLDEFKKILATPLESDLPGFSFVGFPKEESWNQYLVSATAMISLKDQK